MSGKSATPLGHPRALPPCLTRREFLAGVGTCGVVVVLGGPLGEPRGDSRRWRAAGASPDVDSGAEPGRLRSRPGRAARTVAAGTQPLGLASPRDARLYVPAGYRAGRPAPLLVALHGAGGSGDRVLRSLTPMADELDMLLLAPDSRGPTWDAIRGEYGADVDFIDKALKSVFERADVDPARITLGGFSDGASYALSVGLINGDFFAGIIAFSPGFVVPGSRHGKPGIFISHGRDDPILPIDQTSRKIVPELRGAGYAVRFAEFDGGHGMPPEMRRAATDWLKEQERAR